MEHSALIDRIAKLLALAGNNPNENEAAAAFAKANELLTAHNLTMADVDSRKKEGAEKDAARSHNSVRSGFYMWQGWIWKVVADLNFCYTFRVRKQVVRKNGKVGTDLRMVVVGKEHNVQATMAMASWLQQTIEDMCMRWLDGDNKRILSKAAISWKEGCATRVSERITEIINERDRAKNQTQAIVIYRGTEEEKNKQHVKTALGFNTDKMTVVNKDQKLVDAQAYYSGHHAGNGIHIGKVIN